MKKIQVFIFFNLFFFSAAISRAGTIQTVSINFQAPASIYDSLIDLGTTSNSSGVESNCFNNLIMQAGIWVQYGGLYIWIADFSNGGANQQGTFSTALAVNPNDWYQFKLNIYNPGDSTGRVLTVASLYDLGQTGNNSPILVSTANIIIQDNFLTTNPNFSYCQDTSNNPSNFSQTIANGNVPSLPFPNAFVPNIPKTLTKDPIDMASGELFAQATDFSIHSQGPALRLFREYRSMSNFNGLFGYGWHSALDQNLYNFNNQFLLLYDETGFSESFTPLSNTLFVANPNTRYVTTAVLNTDGTYTLSDIHGIATTYNAQGRMSKVTDRNGNALSFVYNPSLPGGTYIQDSTGRQIKLYFDANNHISSASDPAGNTYQYGYDVNGNLVSITDPTGAVTNYDYDSNHKIIQFTNANGHNSYYSYDSQGRVISNYQDNNVNKVTLSYTADTSDSNTTTVVTDSLGNKNTYLFNGTGLLIGHTDPLGALTQESWDVDMNLRTITDANNKVTSLKYDNWGDLIQITDPLENITQMTYTPNFNLIASKANALGKITNFNYDKNGNLTSMVDALGNTHSFIYDQYGNVVTATDSRGNSTNFIYDTFGHLIEKIDALGDATKYSYE